MNLPLYSFAINAHNKCACSAGNHFNEWAGFECNWPALPTDEQQSTFLRAYLERSAELSGAAAPTDAQVCDCPVSTRTFERTAALSGAAAPTNAQVCASSFLRALSRAAAPTDAQVCV